MSTSSTKSRRKQTRQPDTVTPRAKTGAPPPVPEYVPAELSERTWTIFSLFILAVAAALRLYHLSLVPLHHDEGVNGNFLVRLVREGKYFYDPENYHGPTLYYFTAVISWVIRFLFGESAQNTYGLNDVTIRLVPALFGLATVWMVLLLRRQIGRVGSLCAAALLAVSPGAIYLSRYYIHETLFVFFALGLVVAAVKYYESTHPIYLVLASISAALLFATKETFIINVPVIVLALISTKVYERLRFGSRGPQKRSKKDRGRRITTREQLDNMIARFGGPTKLALLAALAVAVFVTVVVLFYSSFFENFPKGVYDSLKTFAVWTQTGQKAHVHPKWKYIEWLTLQEGPIFVLAIFGAGMALWRPSNSFRLFAAFWAFGTLAAYSLVPYKTPWLTLSFIVPLALVAGTVFQTLYEYGGKQSLAMIVVVLALGLSISTYQAIDLNFFNYDNDKETVDLTRLEKDYRPQYYVYVYAHTRRELLSMIDEINRIASTTGEADRIGINLVSPEYWPLPWYFRDFPRVAYNSRVTSGDQPIIIARDEQEPEVETMFGDRYTKVQSGFNEDGSYALRPAVNLLLYVRRDVQQR